MDNAIHNNLYEKNPDFSMALACICACTKIDTESSRFFYTESPTTETDIRFNSVETGAILLDHVESSLSGFLHVANDSLYFIDYRFAWMYTFDKDGNLHERRLGIGQGPSEIPNSGITFYSQKPNGGHIFVGSSYDYYVFNRDLERTQSSIIRFRQEQPVEYLLRNPTPEDQRSYNLAYMISDMRSTNDYVFLPLLGGLPGDTDFHLNSDLYADQARLFAQKHIESGDVERIFGRLSPIFSDRPEIRHFSVPFFDLISDDILAVTFGADSLIHHFDMDFRHIKSYGVSGSNMYTNYTASNANSANEFARHLNDAWSSEGVYTSLRYVPERDFLFRSYSRGNDNGFGIQVYDNGVLVADIDMPELVKISGYISPWFYTSAVINEMEETKTVYRFKLE
ncbi:MAG: hypothetical protein LAT67_14820 [Balneolales bacterium]|nr:hypothetical protein [Balneolales bacterium]